MFLTKFTKCSSIIFAILITTNFAYSKAENDSEKLPQNAENNSEKLPINAKQDTDHLNKEKDLILCFLDIAHESIIKNPELKKKMEEITKKHMESITAEDIRYVINFLDGDSKTKLKALAVHINKVFNNASTLHIFRTVLVKIMQEIHQTPEIINAINNFLKNISNKEPIYKKLLSVEKTYNTSHQEQKDIINSKTTDQAMAIITKIFNKHMISNHNL